ncbi:glycine betaine ABC transporter substrate-binding protein [Shigella flexneri]
MTTLRDTNSDGKADLTGCNPGWGCEGAIDHQLAAYELTHTVTHDQGGCGDGQHHHQLRRGQTGILYTWTPYWVSND